MKINMKDNGSISIDGQNYTGRNIVIKNHNVVIDGIIQDQMIGQEVNIAIIGNVEKIENNSGTVTATTVGSIKTMSGDVNCDKVSGSISTMSGDVTAGIITGDVSTMSGNIHRR